jgi:hypothetical protein
MLGPLIVGTVLGAGLAVLASRRPDESRMRLLAVGLGITALIYVLFAALGGAGARWFAIEVAGLLPFGALAWLGRRDAPIWLALGWAAHVVWDVGLHGGPGTEFVPAWYLPFCVGFDLIVGGYALGLALPAALREESAGPTTH